MQLCLKSAKELSRLQDAKGLFRLNSESELSSTFYTAFSLEALLALHARTQEKFLAQMIKKASSALAKLVDRERNLFYFGTVANKTLKYPLHVAQSAYIASVLRKTGFNGENILSAVLSRQYESGAIASFYGFTDDPLNKKRPKFNFWQDLLPCPVWNAFALQGLAELLEKNAKIPANSASFPCNYEANDYSIKERDSTLVFFDRLGLVSAKWFKRHDLWLFGKISITEKPKKKKPPKKKAKRPKVKKQKAEAIPEKSSKPVPEEKKKGFLDILLGR